MSGSKNPFYGKKHTALTRETIARYRRGSKATPEARQKTSKSRTGKKNHMYGKPPPVGASTGIGGWLNGVYFRSSCELRFLLDHIGESWKSAELNKFRAKYVNSKGRQSRYFPDFFLGNEVVEVKPCRWESMPAAANNKLKIAAGERFCNSKGLRYRVICTEPMTKRAVFELRHLGVIRLNKKQEARYAKWVEQGRTMQCSQSNTSV